MKISIIKTKTGCLIMSFLVFCMLLFLPSCQIIPPATPEITYSETLQMVSWQCVSGADKYIVSINDEESETCTTYCFVTGFEKGTYRIKVKAATELNVCSDYSNELEITITRTVGYVWGEEDEEDISTLSDLVNIISEKYVASNFKIISKPYYIQRTFVTSTRRYGTQSQGSGVIYKKDESGYYYVLTNNHVIANSSTTYKYTEFELTDYLGHTFDTGTLVYSDVNYDLAVIKVRPIYNEMFVEYPVLELDEENPAINENVVTISSPKGQLNTITLGSIKGYSVVSMDEESVSHVEFEVIKHNTPIASGSSGSVLLTYDLKICGINFAAGIQLDGESFSYAIPVEKVREFLENVE